MKEKIPAVIFAGGKSSRMGKDKALLPFGDASSLIHYQYRKLSLIFEEVFLSAKINRTDPEIPLIADRYDVFSPLSGIVSVFEQIDADEIFVLSVDTPLIKKDVIQKILDSEAKGDAVIARNQGKVQPLCGRYRRSILPRIKLALTEDKHKLGRLLQEADTYYVDFEEDHAFMNLNHPHEYEAALLLLHKL